AGVRALAGGRPGRTACLGDEAAVERARHVGWVRNDPEADLPRGPRAQGRRVELAPAAACGKERGPGGGHLALGQGAAQPRLRADEVVRGEGDVAGRETVPAGERSQHAADRAGVVVALLP